MSDGMVVQPEVPLHLTIRYSLERGYEDEALALARRLFAYFDQAIDSLALIPVLSDEFDLRLNGQVVHARSRSGRSPRLSDVLQALRGPESG